MENRLGSRMERGIVIDCPGREERCSKTQGTDFDYESRRLVSFFLAATNLRTEFYGFVIIERPRLSSLALLASARSDASLTIECS